MFDALPILARRHDSFQLYSLSVHSRRWIISRHPFTRARGSSLAASSAGHCHATTV